MANILIVDDNETNRNVLKEMIVTLGHNPVTAKNGLLAMTNIKKQPPDLVLLDILMPKMDGYEVLDHLKSNIRLSNIPVIMISAVDEIKNIVQCIEKGAEDYLVKPFESTLLKARINGCLEKKYFRDQERILHAELERNFAALQRAEQTRDGLFHMIIHDLNNPLASMQLSAEILMHKVDHDKFDREDHAKHLQFIFHGTKEMTALIKGILDVSKLEAGEMSVSLTALKAVQLIKEICEGFASQVEKKGVKLSFEFESDDLMIRADKELLSRILQNLLTNALKHTPRGTNIKISLAQHEKNIIISVTDDGSGIPAQYKDIIFDKFFQAEAGKENKTYGVGLGLTFCKMAAEAQGGKIWVESQEGKGSNFKVALDEA